MININRRELLKLSATSLLAAMVSPFAFGQSNNAPASAKGAIGASAIDGNISYNAGWVVPLEDKNPLLELEAIKTKERQEAVKQKADAASKGAPAKDKSKSISDKFQDILGKVKSFF
jgi:hypothetical protein